MSSTHRPPSGRTLLLVDAEASPAFTMQRTLLDLGYRVRLAHNGAEAIQAVVDAPEIELVLMDVDLGPVMDGKQTAQRVLAERDVPIVFLISHAEHDLVERVRGITRYGCVIKDADAFVLNASVEMAFDLFESHRREHEQRARYEAVVQAQPDLMFVMNADGTYEDAYAPDPSSLAIPREEIPGSHLREMFGDEEAQRHIQVYQRCIQTGAVQLLEYEMVDHEMSHTRRPRTFEARISKLDDERVLAIVREVTESRRVGAELDRMARLQRVLVQVSRECINLPLARVPETIQAALAMIGEAIGADRSYVFDYDFTRGTATNRLEWCAPGIESQLSELQELPLESIAEGLSLHRRGEAHYVPDVRSLPDGPLREVLEPQGIRSLLTVPLIAHDECLGSVGFDFVRELHPFLPEEHGLLAAFAEILVSLRERDEVQDRLRVLFDGARDNILIHEVAADGTPGPFMDVNPSTCETLGYTRDELLRMSPLDTTIPAQRDGIRDALARLEPGHDTLVEAVGRTKDGALIPFEISIHRTTIRGRDTIIAVSRDISERRRAEAMQRLVSDLAPVAISVYDFTRQEFVFTNAEHGRLLGYRTDELNDMATELPERIFHPDERARLEELDRLVREDRDDRIYESDYRFVRKDRTSVWAHVRSAVLTRDPDGSPVSAISTALDITDRKRSEETIAGLLAEKDLVLREVHHRIKNNMLAMTSLLSLQAGAAHDPEAAAALTEAQSRLHSMTVLYDRLYRSDNLSATSLGEYLPALAREIVATHPTGAAVKLSTQVPEIALPIPDTAALGMIANEILSNSLRHAFPEGRGGTIAITAQRSGSMLEVRIADDGEGLPDSVDIGRSTGFGMQLVGSLADQHGFTVSIDRTAGTVFVIRIPYPQEK